MILNNTSKDIISTDNTLKDIISTDNRLKDIHMQLLKITSSISNFSNHDEYFLFLKLFLFNNNFFNIPFYQSNAFLSLIYNKNKNINYNHSPFIIYCNPIHIILLVSLYSDINTCKKIISILLFEYNIIPYNYPIILNNHNDLLFYSYLFGATNDDLALLKYSLKYLKSDIIPIFIQEIINNNKSFTGDTYTFGIPDFISIKYNVNANKNILNKLDLNLDKIDTPIIDSNIDQILNECSRNNNLSKTEIINSFKITLKYYIDYSRKNIINNNYNNEYISKLVNNNNNITFNFKFILRNHFSKYFKLQDQKYNIHIDTINDFNYHLENFTYPNVIMKSITNMPISDIEYNEKLNNKIHLFAVSYNPFLLTYYYNQI